MGTLAVAAVAGPVGPALDLVDAVEVGVVLAEAGVVRPDDVEPRVRQIMSELTL